MLGVLEYDKEGGEEEETTSSACPSWRQSPSNAKSMNGNSSTPMPRNTAGALGTHLSNIKSVTINGLLYASPGRERDRMPICFEDFLVQRATLLECLQLSSCCMTAGGRQEALGSPALFLSYLPRLQELHLTSVAWAAGTTHCLDLTDCTHLESVSCQSWQRCWAGRPHQTKVVRCSTMTL